MSTDNNITYSFPVLTKVTGRPTYHDIATLRKQIYANAKCAGANFGPHGLLGSIMPDTEYIAINERAFEPPVDPGLHIDVAARAADNPIAERNHTAQRKLYMLYDSVLITLRSQLLQAVDTKYLDELEDPVLGFGNVAAKTILAYLFTHYGRIGPVELEKNLNELESAWDASGPIAEIWSRVKKCKTFAAAGNEPIADRTVIHKILKVLTDTGLYGLTCVRWQEMNAENWIWENFREDFDAADRNREYQPTTASKGYVNMHTANAVAAKAPTVNGMTTVGEGGVVWYYCWSHGMSTNPKHTGYTYTSPKDGHKKEATWKEKDGGSQKVKGQRLTYNRGTNDTANEKPTAATQVSS